MNQPQCTTRIELVEHWLAVLKFCEGTDIKPGDCWKLQGHLLGDSPCFDFYPEDYEFAIGLYQGKPVWRAIKKSITINGVECARPSNTHIDAGDNWILLRFETNEEAKAVQDAFNKEK
ncbi:MAG: hypothetical protein A2W25_15125 [candidate division Zixibacteria bacterium RBG_16_53_22]|nr:MAG: hypothetical protein A2W25_15125 [candidate division Zixibacteria bacterium RBG_16_53_22]